MKEMNQETQLRSWRPRRPSAGLKRRLFGFAGEADVPTARVAAGLRWRRRWRARC